MNSSIFQDCTLFISARSPFARRVRVAFHEHGIRFQEKVFDVFQPAPELWKANPLARVPTVVLSTGQILIDSSLILQAFYEESRSPLIPERRPEGRPERLPECLEDRLEDRLEMYRWSAVALGICEKTVEHYLETLRPKSGQDPELYAEIENAVIRSLTQAEQAVANSRGGYLLREAEGPTQADLDWGVALAYLRLRHPLKWGQRFPALDRFVERLERRESFKKTVPPPA